jgi:hypothetical protein
VQLRREPVPGSPLRNSGLHITGADREGEIRVIAIAPFSTR